MKKHITKLIMNLIVWGIFLGVSLIAMGLVIRGIISVWSFLL